MIPVMCIVQEGQISPADSDALRSDIDALAQNAFDASADIDWIEVPLGSGFTAAKPSSAVIVSMHANRSLEAAERIALLQQLGSMCMRNTGRPENDVLAALRDPL